MIKIRKSVNLINKTIGGTSWANLINELLINGSIKLGPTQDRVVAIYFSGVMVFGEDYINNKSDEERAVIIMGEFEHFRHKQRNNEEKKADDAFNLWLKANQDNLQLWSKYGGEYEHRD